MTVGMGWGLDGRLSKIYEGSPLHQRGLQRGAQMSLVTNFLGFLLHLFLVQNVAIAFSSEQNVAVVIFNF